MTNTYSERGYNFKNILFKIPSGIQFPILLSRPLKTFGKLLIPTAGKKMCKVNTAQKTICILKLFV